MEFKIVRKKKHTIKKCFIRFTRTAVSTSKHLKVCYNLLLLLFQDPSDLKFSLNFLKKAKKKCLKHGEAPKHQKHILKRLRV